jgi:MoxR-like ATPase
MSNPRITYEGLTPAALASLRVAGIAARWDAVQRLIHPQLAALAEQIHTRASEQLPRTWPLYELSYKNARYVNSARGARLPIEEYHLAIDRPPRGAGVYVVVSGEEQRVIVALQIGGAQKQHLRQVWEEGRAIWAPLVARMGEVRFAERPRRPRPGQAEPLWIERYLASRSASYLLAGFSYRWDDSRIAEPSFAQQLVADALDLLPLNEAIMEQAELREPAGSSALRERESAYLLPLSADEIAQRIQARGLALPADTLRAYHLALQTKPLVILPGISGTGKTRLTRLYADVVHGVAEGEPNPHYLLVAVQPDWHNARDLLGYYNALTATFHATPLMRFILRAAAEPDAPHFVCLDEMNLARPEYYLAPILSAIETDDRLIDLGAPAPSVATTTGELIQNPLRLPRNLAITGTVNVDESTHPLSDKLVDRANVIELRDVDLQAFRASWRGPVDPGAWELIGAIHAIVARAGQPFGYRAVREMLEYLERAAGVLAPARALDQQLKQKILPKLRGEESARLRRALTDLLALALGHEPGARAAQIPADQIAAALLPESAEKLRRMLERLDADGFTDFYS